MKIRIYTDTSVLGGCEDEEFAEHSIRLMEGFVGGEFVLLLSGLTVQELAAAPVEVRRRLAAVPEAHIETLRLDAESREVVQHDVCNFASVVSGGCPHLMRGTSQKRGG